MAGGSTSTSGHHNSRNRSNDGTKQSKPINLSFNQSSDKKLPISITNTTTPIKNQNQSWTSVVKSNNKDSNSHNRSEDQKTTPSTKHQSNSSNNNNLNSREKAEKDNNSNESNSVKRSGSKVSHVICKFYKVGNCSAGTSCQFSHNLPELGQGKPVCQWFVKGNCRFAHKCALAHIQPGQPISMDRKNKRAAQAAARESAAAAASAIQTDPIAISSPPPELVLEPPELEEEEVGQSSPLEHKRNILGQVSITLKTDNDLKLDQAREMNQLLLESPVLNRQLQPPKSPWSPLVTEIDLELTGQSNEELQFGLPDDFTSLNGHHRQPLVGYLAQQHLSPQVQPPPQPSSSASAATRFLSARLSPSSLHVQLDNSQRSSILRPNSSGAKSPSAEYSQHVPISIERAKAWPREQSPGPFGFGSPFSAPGSRSIFLPRQGSYGSEDGFPRSAPSVTASPRHMSFLGTVNASVEAEEDIWNSIETGGDEDVTELLPSSLHSLLTPEERCRQHLRKLTTNDLFSRSVPNENTIDDSLKIKQNNIQSSSLRHQAVGYNANGDGLSVSVSPAPPEAANFTASNGYLDELSSPQRRSDFTPESNFRPQPISYLSSSYIQPSGRLGTRADFYSQQNDLGKHHQFQQQQHYQQNLLSPVYDSPSPRKDFGVLGVGSVLGHAPGTSLPQGLAAGLSRLHFQPPLPTGLTPCGSPLNQFRDNPLSPPKSPPSLTNHLKGLETTSTKAGNNLFQSALSQRMAGSAYGSIAGGLHNTNIISNYSNGRGVIGNSSPLSRHVSCSPSPGLSCSPTAEDDDAPFKLEI
ncbi:hypothetical protein PPACK8108_LOCUS97 [Phakopsora pachyrhizi]|uniref:C3H1-type domain-containing protein n=1 Tax=Phakopsora pachyrhizi TaxID=170000 RepID=A0AAV0AEI5_PHAPC|nr:hypothetical protein PPACK8108_LOCUS97 [Phakopsora pachyrhizi]